jgi:hypothetical protein
MLPEYRARLASEYHYAATRMHEEPLPAKKLYYFSVLFGEAQRLLNLGWDRDLALIYAVTFHTHSQVNAANNPLLGFVPIQWQNVLDNLTKASSDLASYMEKPDAEANRGELCEILTRLAEVSYAVSGNGAYMCEKGEIKL